MAVASDSPYKSLSDMQKDSTEYTETDDDMEKMVTCLSRGLAEI